MELRQLRYFVAVAEEGSFAAAAQRLNISQPPITRQVRSLEEELGVLLLHRTSKGVQLTPAGDVFLDDARGTLSHLARSVERTKAAFKGEMGTLEVGYFGSTIYSAIPRALRRLKQDLPDVKVSLTRLSKSKQADGLRTGSLHIGFGRYYHNQPDLEIETLFNEPLCLAVPVEWTLPTDLNQLMAVFEQRPLTLFPSSDRPNFADAVLAMFRDHHVDTRDVSTAEDVRSAITLAGSGQAATVVPASAAQLSWDGVRFVELPQSFGRCPVSYMTRRGETSALVRRVRTVLATFSQESQ